MKQLIFHDLSFVSLLTIIIFLVCMIASPPLSEASESDSSHVKELLESCIMKKDSLYYFSDTTIDGEKYRRRAVIVNCSRDALAELLLDQSWITKFLPKVKEYRHLNGDRELERVYCSSKPKWFLKTYACTVQVSNNLPESIHWKRISGDFDYLDFEWNFYVLDEKHTIAIFSGSFRLGNLIPEFLVGRSLNGRINKTMRNFAVWVNSE